MTFKKVNVKHGSGGTYTVQKTEDLRPYINLSRIGKKWHLVVPMRYLGYLKSYRAEGVGNESSTSRLVMNLVLSNDNTKAFILEASFRVLVLYICQRNFCMSNAFPIVLKHNDLGE